MAYRQVVGPHCTNSALAETGAASLRYNRGVSDDDQDDVGTQERVIRLRADALVVLAGPSASGKSTWAANWFRDGQIVSSDQLRSDQLNHVKSVDSVIVSLADVGLEGGVDAMAAVIDHFRL